MKGRGDKADTHRGARIRALRKALEWNQANLAEKIGVDQSTVSDIERGSSFSADLLMRLSEALGISPTFIMQGEDASFWPFKLVPMPDILALEPEKLGYVEGVLSNALERLSLEPTDADVKRLNAAVAATSKRMTRRKSA
jgi:transcriptional regulator with XRE-family HTH domain